LRNQTLGEKMKNFDVCMIGLGPVGTISGACFAKQGFNVIGVDNNPQRVEAFKGNRAPFVEPGVDELIDEVISAGKFRATLNFDEAVRDSRIIMIAVGTPTPESGSPDLSYLDAVAVSLGKAFKTMEEKGTIVVVRSTVPPGTMRDRLAPQIEKHSGLKAGVDFHIASNPEFLREGLAIKDFFDTGRVVIGADSDEAAAQIEALYKDVNGQRIRTTIETGEFAKYVDNTWHALKVAFGNEIGRTVKAFGGSVEDTTKIFLADDKLNISTKYLRPGFAFGGSCLPKDVRGLNWFAGLHGANLPIVTAIMHSNEEQIDQGVAAVLATGARKIALLGIAFKEDVDDLREAPALYVAQKLRAAGVEVVAHDPCYPAGETVSLPRNGGMLDMIDLESALQNHKVLVKFHNISIYNVLSDLGKHEIVDLTKVVQTTPADETAERAVA
jgi:GDP-mannose 6-dehydrogenase